MDGLIEGEKDTERTKTSKEGGMEREEREVGNTMDDLVLTARKNIAKCDKWNELQSEQEDRGFEHRLWVSDCACSYLSQRCVCLCVCICVCCVVWLYREGMWDTHTERDMGKREFRDW